MFTALIFIIIANAFGAPCRARDVGVSYSMCNPNGTRDAVFYYKTDCTPFWVDIQNITEVECNYTCAYNQYFDVTNHVCRNCANGNTSLPSEIIYDSWPDDFASFTLGHDENGTDWTVDDFGITTGIQYQGAHTNISFSFDIINTTGNITFYYKGYYGGTFSLYVDGAQVSTSLIYGGMTLNGSWIVSTYQLPFGRHSATFVYSVSSYTNFTNTAPEGVRIQLIVVTGTGYLNLECEECEPGQYGNGGVCYPCPINTYSTEAGSVECTPCEDGFYSLAGSTECLERSICDNDDYRVVYGECIDGLRQVSYEEILPKICKDGNPPSTTTETCGGCAPGSYRDSSTGNCKVCEDGYYRGKNDLETKCQPCEVGTAAYKSTYFTSDTLISHDDSSSRWYTSCSPHDFSAENFYEICDSGGNGWHFLGDSIISGNYYEGPVTTTLQLHFSGSYGSSIEFSYSTHLQSGSNFVYWKQNSQGKNISTNVANVSESITIDGTSVFFWQFNKRSKGYKGASRISDYVEIHYIILNGIKDAEGGATSCKPCGDGTSAPVGSIVCTQCSPGTYASVANNDAECKTCPPGQYTPNNGSSSCLECGKGSIDAQEHSTCEVKNCGVIVEGDVYDLSQLNLENEMFGPFDVPNHRSHFYFAPCTYTNTSNYCRFPPNDDGEVDVTTITTLACEVDSRGVYNVGNYSNITHYMKMINNEETGEVEEVEHGLNVTFYGGESGNILIGEPVGARSAEVLFICLPNAGVGKPVKSTDVDFVTSPHTYHFRWESEYACRLCRSDDYEPFVGDCVKPGTRQISYVVKNGTPCSHGEVPPVPYTEKCKLPMMTLNGGGLFAVIIGAIAVVVIIIVIIVLLIRKNRALKYQLFQSETFQTGGAQGGSGTIDMGSIKGGGGGGTSMFTQ